MVAAVEKYLIANTVGEGVDAVYNAWGKPVSYSVSQKANGINFKQVETIQYDALGRVLGEFESGTFPGQASTISTQHTLTYDALTGQMISEINTPTISANAPQGTDPARYVYGPDGHVILREMGTFGATTPTQWLYALTDPTGTVEAIPGASSGTACNIGEVGNGIIGFAGTLGAGIFNDAKAGSWALNRLQGLLGGGKLRLSPHLSSR